MGGRGLGKEGGAEREEREREGRAALCARAPRSPSPPLSSPPSPQTLQTLSKNNPRLEKNAGSCTGGKTEDFLAAAKLLHRAQRTVKVPTYLVPATQKVWADVYTLPVPGCGGKTAAEIFEAAGCVQPAAPSCAACLGGPRDTFARMNEPEVCVSTTNRNFPGRMGHKARS